MTKLKMTTTFFALVIGLVVFGAPGLCAEPKLTFGAAAPTFSLKSSTGKKIALSQFRGKNTVIIAFWLADYAPILEEMEKLRVTLKDKRFKNVKVLAITRGKDEKEKKDALLAFKSHKLDFPILWDEDYKVSKAYEFFQPGFYLINSKGALTSTLISTVTERIRDMAFEEILAKTVKGEKVDILQFLPRVSVSPYAEMLGRTLPDFMLKDLGKTEQAPAFYRGFKKVIVVFWRYNCPHCRKELPHLQSFYKKYHEDLNFEILAVTTAENQQVMNAVENTAQLEGLTFPVVIDRTGKTLESYSASRVPMFYIADTSGVIREIFSGEVPFLEDTFAAIMKEMDAKKGKK